ncbi:MAG: alpha/beta fold hydrolase [bacterium]
MSGRPRPGAGCSIRESRRKTAAGVEYDLYEPASAPRRTVVLLHGITLRGEKDPRLVRLARAMAASGLRAAAVSLPGLKSCRFDRSDLRAILDSVEELRARTRTSIAVAAFSVGAGLALRAAAEPERAGDFDLLLLFGPYDSLRELWISNLDRYESAPQAEADWDGFVWLRMVLSYPVLENLALTEEERREFVGLLEAYCEDDRIERKRGFYERALKSREGILAMRAAATRDLPDLAHLSPANRLSAVTARVLIVHAADDPLVPPEHSERIMAALQAGGRGDHRLLLSKTLSHVTCSSYRHLTDGFRILGMFAELFREQPAICRTGQKKPARAGTSRPEKRSGSWA